MPSFRLFSAFVCLLAASVSHAQQPAAVFAALDGYRAARLSPDGERLAYLYPIEDRYHLVVHTFDSGNNQLIPPLEGLDFNWLEWANDEVVVFSMSYSAFRNVGRIVESTETRLVSVDLTNSKTTALIRPAEKVGTTGSRTAREYHAPPQIQDDVVDWLIDDPETIRVALDDDHDGRYEVRDINVRTGAYRTHRKSTAGIQDWVADPSGDIRLGFGFRVGERRVIVKNEDGDWLSMNDADWFTQGWRPVAFVNDQNEIYVSGYGDRGTLEIRTLDLGSGEFTATVYSNAPYDAHGLAYHPVTHRPVGVRSIEHFPRVVYFDDELAKLSASINKVLAGSFNRILSMSANGRKVLLHSADARDPGALMIWDRDAGSLEPFGWYNENLDPEQLSETKPVSYQAADGTEIPAYLTLPLGAGEASLPTVILPHGGPHARDDQSYGFLQQFLASRGYAVLQPNFRGSAGYGASFRDSGLGQWGGLMQTDVDDGARWLIDEGIAEPSEICIVGWSYGAYSAAMGLINSPDLYRCGAGINGVYNLPQLVADDNQYVGGSTWTRHIGLDGESSRKVSPYHQVDKIEVPFLVIHADDDHRVKIGHAEQFSRALEEHNQSGGYLTLPHGGHSLRNSQAREQLLNTLERFLADAMTP